MRPVFDFNIHLPYVEHKDVNVVIENDLALDNAGLIKGLDKHRNKFKGLKGGNILLFNTSLFSGSSPINFMDKAQEVFGKLVFTALIDFRRNDIEDYLDHAVSSGVKAVMVNSYLQKIGENYFDQVVRAYQYAAAKGLILCVDGSYGTSKMYTYDNMKLACLVADAVSSVPIVIVHSGGLRVMNAMLLAAEKGNVWLDTSFSLPYYIGSSLEQDFAFAYKSIGTDRVIYGSDIPYLNSDQALKTHLDFFEKHNFSSEDVDKIMYKNASRLFGLDA